MHKLFSDLNREKLYALIICIIVISLVFLSFNKSEEITESSCNHYRESKNTCLYQLGLELKDSQYCDFITNKTQEFYCLKELNNAELNTHYCNDSTEIESCSTYNAGLFCNSKGRLVPSCSTCGCPQNGNWYCYSDGTCLACPTGTSLEKDKKCHTK